MIRDRIRNLFRRLSHENRGWEPPPPARDRVPLKKDHFAGHLGIQPGDGDTPGPNHRFDIGVPWVAAQVAAGAPPFMVDLRDDEARAMGHLPGAIHIRAALLAVSMDLLPDRETRVILYDDDGKGPSAQGASLLRDAGWDLARRLAGGFAGWVALGEPIERNLNDGS